MFHILSWYLEKDQSEETQIDAFSTDPLCQLGALTHQFHACEYFYHRISVFNCLQNFLRYLYSSMKKTSHKTDAEEEDLGKRAW